MTEHEDLNGTELEEGVTHRLAAGAGPRGLEDQRERDARAREQRDTMGRERSRQDLLRQLSALESGPAGFIEDDVPLLAWCGNAAGCSDDQVPVIGRRTTFAASYRMGGDDGPHADRVERSWVEFSFTNPEDAVCKECGAGRHISDQERPTYENRSGFDQRALLKLARTFTNSSSAQQGDVVQAAKVTPTSPLDALAHRLAAGELEIERYRELRAVLEEASNGKEAPETEPETVVVKPKPKAAHARAAGPDEPDAS